MATPPLSMALRALIEQFLQERLNAKLEKLSADDGDDKRDALVAQFQFENWIEDAARRVAQLQVVTHSLKPIHPDAKGTNLYAPPDSLNRTNTVGSHVLPADFSGDVVGNAAALDVYKFLKLEYQGTSLLGRVLEDDPDLAAALSADPDQARRWMRAFAAITEPGSGEASHTRAKQLYWLVGDDPADDDAYHLLAPLYATSLAHQVFQTINEDRFGDATKEARKARRERAYSETGYRDYPDLAVQKFGGTKPQNISQLNSERGGNNYLLASLPPRWSSADVRVPLYVNSALQHFGRRPTVRRLLRDLRRFLQSDPSATYETRNRRDDLNAALMDELMLFSLELLNLPPGWSADENCRLPEEEQFWLDPGRAELDEEFRRKRQDADWPAEIRGRFATWMNGQLESGLPVGDVEHRHWSQALKRELDAWQGGLAYD